MAARTAECTNCGAALDTADSPCPRCAGDLDAPTLTRPGPPPGGADAVPRREAKNTGFDAARFVPGTVLADRYRIVGQLGRGGMGEVYRAEDLKLDETVALKLLPDELTRDGPALARFHQELKVARRITHKNVCRVFDIGEDGGLHFLSMEYVDGEDLASLLRRIGRLPEAKAVDFSRQLCAGLAAAHGEGVLHRDLKPANVMVDGQGQAKIMDFGLAGLAGDFPDGELAGTPAYMAPEQLARREVSLRTDLYALGLILFEAFTGQHAFPTAAGKAGMRRSDPPSAPSSIVEGIDPQVERTLMRCLEDDPELRPASALDVSASLPGGDPLAAALRAGETPSPEMVAAAPDTATLPRSVAVGCFVAVLVLLAGWLALAAPAKLVHRAGLEKSPEVLAERAAGLTARWSGRQDAERAAYHTFGWWIRQRYLKHLQENASGPDPWATLAEGRPAAMTFWYVESPNPLYPKAPVPWPQPDDPPLVTPGMTRIELDPRGRLLSWHALPKAPIGPPSDGSPAWEDLFSEAGLEPADFRPTAPRWAPPIPSDHRLAWEGTYPGRPEPVLRIEASALAARPVFFAVVEPWDEEPGGRMAMLAPTNDPTIATLILYALILIAGGWLAWKHLKTGRGDRRGAARLATLVFASLLLSDLVGGYHSLAIGEAFAFLRRLGTKLFAVATLWVAYMALEPILRRLLPHSLVAWTRLLAGRWRDPRVGRDVLIGSVAATAGSLVVEAASRTLPLLGHPRPLWSDLWLGHLLAPRQALAVLLDLHLRIPLLAALGMTVLFLLIYSLLPRKKWLSASVFFVLAAFFFPFESLLISLPWSALLTVVIVRFGLLATTSLFAVFMLLMQAPMTTDFSIWYADRAVFSLVLVVALAFAGLRISQGNSRSAA